MGGDKGGIISVTIGSRVACLKFDVAVLEFARRFNAWSGGFDGKGYTEPQ